MSLDWSAQKVRDLDKLHSYVEVFGAHIPSIPQPDLTFIESKKGAAA